MIYTPGPPPYELDRELDRLVSQSHSRRTDSGFEFFVVDHEQMGGLTAGEIIRREGNTELLCILNDTIPPNDQENIANITLTAATIQSEARYKIPHAGQQLVESGSELDADTFRALEWIARDTLSTSRANSMLTPAEKGTLERESRSVIGWVAIHRDLTEEGEHEIEKLSSAGIIIPGQKSEQQLTGLMLTGQARTTVASFQTMEERSERHHCADCSGQILRTTDRITLSLDENDGYSDHHHYHASCFADTILPKFNTDSLVLVPKTYA